MSQREKVKNGLESQCSVIYGFKSLSKINQ